MNWWITETPLSYRKERENSIKISGLPAYVPRVNKQLYMYTFLFICNPVRAASHLIGLQVDITRTYYLNALLNEYLNSQSLCYTNLAECCVINVAVNIIPHHIYVYLTRLQEAVIRIFSQCGQIRWSSHVPVNSYEDETASDDQKSHLPSFRFTQVGYFLTGNADS